VAQGEGYDELGRQDSGSDGAKPGAEIFPDGGSTQQGECLEQALGDEAELYVSMVGADLPADFVTVDSGFAVKVLVSETARTRSPYTS
jgi:hypothetical protein